MIVITGAAGFIGSNLLAGLNREDYNDIVLVDDFSSEQKNRNIEGKAFSIKIDRDDFQSWLRENHRLVQFVFHIGARTDTTEFDKTIFDRLNLNYSKMVWEVCSEYGLPLIYASSAATYGLGEHGFRDDHDMTGLLKPLNPYGESKNDFDNWALARQRKPYFWAGLKYFNVYGPNEYHKGRMASVVFQAHKQIRETGMMKLFRSHDPSYADGGQKRDFIWVGDVVDVMCFMMKTRKFSGIYNVGSGLARSFMDLAKITFHAMGVEERIVFIDTPVDIREKYQYFTEADTGKLRGAGYETPFTGLEEGIQEYVGSYLSSGKYF